MQVMHRKTLAKQIPSVISLLGFINFICLIYQMNCDMSSFSQSFTLLPLLFLTKFKIRL